MEEKARNPLLVLEKNVGLIAGLIARLGEILEREDWVIRPSVAFECIKAAIKHCLEYGHEDFVNHEDSWAEAMRVVETLEKEAQGSDIDTKYAMKLGVVVWDVGDTLNIMTILATKFAGQMADAKSNRFIGTFGEVTPSECLKAVWWVLRYFAPSSHWHPGMWKSPAGSVRGMYQTWPWARYVTNEIRLAYLSLQDQIQVPPRPGAGGGGYSTPWIGPGWRG